MAKVTVKKVLKFREKRRSERVRYLGLFDEIITGPQQIHDPGALAGYFETQAQNMQSVLAELEQALRDIAISSVLNVKSVSFPILAAALGSMASHVPWAYLSPAIGFAVGIAGSLHEMRTKKKQKLAGSPHSYLYFMGREIIDNNPYWYRRLNTETFEWIVTTNYTSQYPLVGSMADSICDFLYD
jgi:hypothetical protein